MNRLNRRNGGLTMPELMVSLGILGLVTGLGWSSGADALARQQLDSASRRLGLGIEHARSEAQRRNTACGLSLNNSGWGAPAQASLPACLASAEPLQDAGLGRGALRVQHNLPPELRFSSNGLVLDGGTVVLSARGTALRRCLVMALPLGVVRVGRYQGDPSAAPNSNACLPDPSL